MRAALIVLAGCATGRGEPLAPDAAAVFEAWCPADAEAVKADVQGILAEMSLEAKVAQMAGDQTLPNDQGRYDTPEDTVHGIPAFRMVDGPRGASDETGPATAFPVAIARGATFDPDLERRVGEAIAQEVRAVGANVLLAPTINVLRHPRWGRSQETYGEDPHHLGVLGAAFVEGAQGPGGVLAQPKHLAVNSIEDTRFDVDVQIDDSALHEVYLPHFRRTLLDAGAATVMSAYNGINGAPASESAPLLTGVLRDGWQWPGVVVSDWIWATETTAGAATAGLDVEMPRGVVYGEALVQAVESGEVDEARVDEAVRRILHTKLCFGLELGEPVLDPSLRNTAAHRALAQEVAERATVLLHHEAGALPLEPGLEIAVGGRLANVENIGDDGSSAVLPPEVVTVWEGLEAAAASHDWTVLRAEDVALDEVDAVVLVVGLTAADEGEGLIAAGDREGLELAAEDREAIAAAARENDRVIVILEGGGALLVEGWIDDVEAALMAWYPGQEGGTALARLLAGEVPFTGRLPFVLPVAEDDLPTFDNTSLEVVYDHWHGYRHLEREGTAPRYPYGHGLALTDFALGETTVAVDEAGWTLRVPVENTGERAGVDTVFAFAGWADPPAGRPARQLVGFTQLALEPGEMGTAEIFVEADALDIFEDGHWQRPGGVVDFWVRD